MGVNLLGRLAGVDGHHVRFADDLAESVASAMPDTPTSASC